MAIKQAKGEIFVYKSYKYLFLLPIAILIAFSIYFGNISKQIEAAMQQEHLLKSSGLFQLFGEASRGGAALIAVTAILNIAMVYIICRFAKADKI